jgi:hypothetical protein
MSDYYLRANTKAAMQNAFLAAGITVQGIDGEVVDFDGIRLDIGWIGPVVRPDPADPEAPPTVDNRYHANLRAGGELPASVLDALPILDPSPSNPMRVWG